MQLAFVPRDVPAALEHWTKVMGVGPFFLLPHVGYRSATYRGAPSNIDLSAYIGYWGDIQIELVEQHCDSPSIYRPWIDGDRDGLHHVCILADSMREARDVCASAGIFVVQEMVMDGAEAIYVDAGSSSPLVEIFQASPALLQGAAMMRDAARHWDGKDPLRRLG